MKKLKKYLGEILLVVGSFITTFNLFNFQSSSYGDRCGDGGFPSLPGFGIPEGVCIDPATYYYYSYPTILLLSLGVVLIVLGVLIIKRKNS